MISDGSHRQQPSVSKTVNALFSDTVTNTWIKMLNRVRNKATSMSLYGASALQGASEDVQWYHQGQPKLSQAAAGHTSYSAISAYASVLSASVRSAWVRFM
jgi:hypothetical protein